MTIDGDCVVSPSDGDSYYWPGESTPQFSVSPPVSEGQTCNIVSITGNTNPIQINPIDQDVTVTADCSCSDIFIPG